MLKAEVVEFFGGPTATAKAIGLTTGAVSQWGEEVPSTRVKVVELAMAAEREKRKREQRNQARRQAKQQEKGVAHV